MKNSRSAVVLIALASLFITLSHTAYAQQDDKNKLKIETKQVTGTGSDVRILTGSEKILLQPMSGMMLIIKVSKQNEQVGMTPFDIASQTMEISNGEVTMRDKMGHSITIVPGVLPAPPAVSNTKPNQPSQDQDQPQPKKKKRYVDPVTDRGHVIP